MTSVIWDGPDPIDRKSCPYSVDFLCKPAPAECLNSLESGRLLLTVSFNDNVDAIVKSVMVKIINNAKQDNLDKVEGTSHIKHQTSVLKELVQEGRHQNRWSGELSIPSSWIEGATQAYEKTGSASPKSSKNLFTLCITYQLDNRNSCTASFSSKDVFHWQARSDTKM